MKRRICWITSDCFVDCDFEIEIFKKLLNHYQIDWYILLPNKNSRYKNFNFKNLESLTDLNIEILESNYPEGSIKRFSFYFDLFNRIKKSNYDIFYINCPPTPFWIPLVYLLDNRKLIFAFHQGDVHRGFDNRYKHKIVRCLILLRIKFINMFSESELNIFKTKYPKKNTFIIPLALKDFGKATHINKTPNKVKFLVFGQINYGKNIDLLIRAAINIYKKGYKNFIVSINGSCKDWDSYQQLISVPEIFDLNIKLIENNEIPNLFCTSHYLVQPYRIVTQSGPLKIALNYNLPIICSNLPGFMNDIQHNYNGILFQSESLESLEDALILGINNIKMGRYDNMVENVNSYKISKYSHEIISNKYIDMFRRVGG